MDSHNRPDSELIDRLRNRIRKFETACRVEGGDRVSSGCGAIDGLLPGGGYPRGALVQWLSGGGRGASYLSLLAAKEACEAGGALVVFDPRNEFFPPAAAAIGINLDHLIILRSEGAGQNVGAHANETKFRGDARQGLSNDFLWSIDQALRCPAVAAVWGLMGHLDERWFRRFQLSAESSGALGMLVQPIHEAREPSWAEVQWLVRPGGLPVDGSGHSDSGSAPASPVTAVHSLQAQQVRLQLARCRGASTGKSINLSINTITGSVRRVRQEHEYRRENQVSRNGGSERSGNGGSGNQARESGGCSRGGGVRAIAESGGG